MARVTVEDCIKIIENPFELIMLAAQRSRDLSEGAQLTIEKPSAQEKNPVLALREIEEQTVKRDMLETRLMRRWQSEVEIQPEEKFLAPDSALAGVLSMGEDSGSEEETGEEEEVFSVLEGAGFSLGELTSESEVESATSALVKESASLAVEGVRAEEKPSSPSESSSPELGAKSMAEPPTGRSGRRSGGAKVKVRYEDIEEKDEI